MSTTLQPLDPRGKTFAYWSSLLSEQLAPLGIVRGGQDGQWQDWARNLTMQLSVLSQGAPEPGAFKHWQDWATQLMHYTITF